MSQGIKQLEEKNVGNEITHMVWSSRMDLVAFSNVKGEVALHRLSWSRAWVLSPPKDGLAVNGICWRPDGKVLAISYNDGCILLINVETKAILTRFEINGQTTSISWVQEKQEVQPKNSWRDNDKEQSQKFVDLSKPYIKDPPPVSHLEGSINFEDIKGLTSFLQDQSEFNLLVVGTKEGLIHIRIFGCWNCLVLNVSEKLGYCCSVQNIQFSEDLSKLFVTIINEVNDVRTVLFDTGIFQSHTAELYHITMKYIKMYELIAYLGKILSSITETWESILLEIDKKLAKYASQVPEGGVTADFLDLLMFGVCSERIEEFLIVDLTKKGLEKFGQTMETSYSNIQSYLFRHIVKFSQNGTFHLSELKGMAAFEERFKIIGLDAHQIRKAIQSNGAFVIKASEMQQIINHSVINYKAFFRWLYASIMHLMDEPIPADIQKMTQQDLVCITEFLKNFDYYGQSDKKNEHKFVMERLGQYLLDEDLSIKPDMSGNDWTQFLEENECLKEDAEILKHYEAKSLVQVYNQLKRDVEKVFEAPPNPISQTVTPITHLTHFNFDQNTVKSSSINISNDMIILAILKPPCNVYIFQIFQSTELETKCGNFYFQSDTEDDAFQVIDLEFYSPSILSLLLQQNHSKGGLFQFPITTALDFLHDVKLFEQIDEERVPKVNAWSFGQKTYKNVEMPVCQFSVSGSRRVSIVLAENKRKIKLFEMECEEEEDEEVETSSSFLRDESSIMT